MGDAVRVIEIVSYALIVLIGLRLLWVKGRAFLRLWRGEAHAHARSCARSSCARARSSRITTTITTTRTRPRPGATRMRRSRASLPGTHWLRRGLAAIVAVGLRPCSGAIIVLVFALAQGLFWIGVASTFMMGLGTAITVARRDARGRRARLCRPSRQGQARRRHAAAARRGDGRGDRDRRCSARRCSPATW